MKPTKETVQNLLNRIQNNVSLRASKTQKIPSFLEQQEPCKKVDIILLDSAVLSFGGLLKKDFFRFEQYKTNTLLDLNTLANQYLDLVQQEKIFFTERVSSELDALFDLVNYRLQHIAVLPKVLRNSSTKFQRNNYSKSKKNKELYKSFHEKIYSLKTIAKAKIIRPRQTDEYLFNIVKAASDIRKLKSSEKFHKEHDADSITDEWLVTHAYNQLFNNQNKVAILTNDSDITRLLLEMNIYFRSPFMKWKVPYCSTMLQKKPIYVGNTFVNDFRIPDQKIAEKIGYSYPKKSERREFVARILSDQQQFLKLMRERQELFYLLQKQY